MSDHIPESVKFGLATLAVKRISIEDVEKSLTGAGEIQERLGTYSFRALRIEVARGVPELVAWTSLFHEVGHHATEAAGFEQGQDERMAEWFGWAIVQLMIDNPGLQNRILADLGDEPMLCGLCGCPLMGSLPMFEMETMNE